MYRKISDFEEDWRYESEMTLRVLRGLTDASLDQRVTPEGRSIGRLAWHITASVAEMLEHAGLAVDGPPDTTEAPASAARIAAVYAEVAGDALEAVTGKWTDEGLLEEVPMYGEMWRRGKALDVLILHQTHHRGQLTVLMRQAGLTVPGCYGPAREEWAAFGMPAAK
ncbi:MAG TPA: DinB family protein [Longimicrobiaceae bacterium]|nr:DinB family protein [Longimicrobiaceae bacterium]